MTLIKTLIISIIILSGISILAAQKPVLVLPVGHTDGVSCLNYSADGEYLVSGSKDKTVKLWNREGRLIRTFSGHDSPLLDVLISPDQEYVLARTDSSFYLWHFTGALQWKQPAIPPPNRAMVAEYDQPSFSKNGALLLFAGPDGKANLYDLRAGSVLKLPCDRPATLSFSPDQQLVMTGHKDSLLFFDQQGQLQSSIPVQNEAIPLFPAFKAQFIDNDRILLSFAYATEQIIRPDYDFQNGGFSKILNIDGQLQQTIGTPLVIRTAPDGKHYRILGSTAEEQEISLLTMAWSTGGPTNSSDQMDWNDLKVTPDKSKMILSNRQFAHIRELPSGRSIMIRLKTTEDPTDFHPLGFDSRSEHLAVKSDKNLTIYNLSGSAPTALTLQIEHDFQGSCPFGGWPSPFAFTPDSDQIVIGDEKGNIWVSSLQADPVRRYGPAPVQQVVAVQPDEENTGLADFYFSDDGIDVSQQAWKRSESTVLKQSFDLEGGRPLAQEVVERNTVPIKRENRDQTEPYHLSSSYDFGLEDFYNGAYFNPSAGIISIYSPEQDQVEIAFRPSASMFDLGLVQNRYLLTSDFTAKPTLWDLNRILARKNEVEIVELYDDMHMGLIPQSLLSDARIREFDQLPVRTKYLALGKKQAYALVKKRNEWQIINKNGFDQYAETQYLDFQLLHIESGQTVNFSGHPLKLLGACFLPGENKVISWAEDRTCRIWDAQSGKELLKIFWITEKDWVVLSPEGLFDASPGLMNSLYYVVGKDEIIELEQLKARYYEPGLLQKVLGYSDEQIRPVEGLETIELYPEVEARIAGNELLVDLRARNGGIGKLSVFINGKEVTEDANPLPPDGKTERPTSLRYDLQLHRQYLFTHPDSTNLVSLRVFNKAGWLKSPAIELAYHPSAVSSRGSNRPAAGSTWSGQLDPKLYVIAVGTSNYTGEKLDLQYADQDATMMARALQSVGTALFTNGDSLEVHCLSTAPADNTGLEDTPISWQFATKSNIESVFTRVAQKAKAEDVVAVYLSGHGLSYGSAEQTQFYYLTQGIASDDLSDEAVRRAYTLSSEELTLWLKNIPALKQVLIIDACNSGRIVENLTGGTKSLNSSQIRALDRMKDRTGMFVLSGSASDKVSYEASEYGQGLLTYALLQGMLGVATRKDTKGQEIIDVMKLFQYARDQVPELARTINGIQTPMLGFPDRAASFDIGILDENSRKNLPIGNRKPVVIRSNFMNQNTLRDDLNLEHLLEAAFREETEEGKSADLIYIDVNDYPNAYSLGGLYSTSGVGEDISITVRVFRDNKPVTDLEIRPTDDPERLVRYIVREVKRLLRER